MDTKHQDLLLDYLYEELPPEQRAEYEAALRASPSLQAEVEALQRTRAAFAAIEELDVPAAISEKLLAEARHAIPTRPGFLARLRASLQLLVLHPAMSAAVVMVAVLGVSFYVYRHGAPPNAVPTADPLRPLPAATPNGAAAGAPAEPSVASKREAALEPRKQAAVAAQQNSDALRNERGQAGRGAQAAATRPPMGPPGVGRAMGETQQRQASKALGLAAPQRARAYKGSRKNDRMRRSNDRLAMDDLANTAGDRRERSRDRFDTNKKGLRGGGGKAAVMPAARPVRPAPAKKPRSTGGVDKEAEASRGWMRLGHQAVAAGRCAVAFDYYTRALQAEPSLLAQISARVGSCHGELRRSGAHGWLASRIHGQERRPARRKAKRRVQQPQQQRLDSK